MNHTQVPYFNSQLQSIGHTQSPRLPVLTKSQYMRHSGDALQDIVSQVFFGQKVGEYRRHGKKDSGCDYVDHDLRMALEAEFRGLSHPADLAELLDEVIEKLVQWAAQGYHCVYVFSSDYPEPVRKEIDSILNSCNIQVIHLSVIPHWKLGINQYSFDAREWSKCAVQELRYKFLYYYDKWLRWVTPSPSLGHRMSIDSLPRNLSSISYTEENYTGVGAESLDFVMDWGGPTTETEPLNPNRLDYLEGG